MNVSKRCQENGRRVFRRPLTAENPYISRIETQDLPGAPIFGLSGSIYNLGEIDVILIFPCGHVLKRRKRSLCLSFRGQRKEGVSCTGVSSRAPDLSASGLWSRRKPCCDVHTQHSSLPLAPCPLRCYSQNSGVHRSHDYYLRCHTMVSRRKAPQRGSAASSRPSWQCQSFLPAPQQNPPS